MNRRLTAITAIALAAGALTACGSSDEETPATPTVTTAATETPTESFQTSEPPASPTESTPPDASLSPAPDEAPFPADTTADTADASADAQLVLVDIRTGLHEGFDRVVLEFSGPGDPGWVAEYTLSASRQGSGEAIELEGAVMLDVLVQGTTYPAEGEDGLSFGDIPTAGTQVIEAVFNDGTFEGLTHVVLGIDQERPFRVFAIADPPRVVIDVQH